MPAGRPRNFDRDAALAAATRVFWEKGYRDASMEDLTAATGVNKPSLYAAFGGKEAMFTEAVRHYVGRYVREDAALLGQSADGREAVRAFLVARAVRFTDPDLPPGCLITSHAGGAAGTCEAAAEAAADADRATRTLLRTRLTRARAEGQLTGTESPAALADHFAATLHGLSVAARVGHSRRALLGTVDLALRAWPVGSGGRESAVAGRAVG